MVDLAKGHVKALGYLETLTAAGKGGMEVVNLGTGKAVSVKELITAFGKAAGKDIPFSVGPRRPGDVEAVWADAAKAERLLGWRAEKTLADMCEDSWRWVSKNPDGYAKVAE